MGQADLISAIRLGDGNLRQAGIRPPAAKQRREPQAEKQLPFEIPRLRKLRQLARMPDDERTVILLAYQHELSQSEIAERLGWPLGTVKTRTRRALARLRGVLGAEEMREAGARGGVDGPQ